MSQYVASEIAGRQPDEHARQARERAFPLKATVDLMDEQAAFGLILERLKPVAMTRGDRQDRQPWIGRWNQPRMRLALTSLKQRPGRHGHPVESHNFLSALIIRSEPRLAQSTLQSGCICWMTPVTS